MDHFDDFKSRQALFNNLAFPWVWTAITGNNERYEAIKTTWVGSSCGEQTAIKNGDNKSDVVDRSENHVVLISQL